MAQELRLTFEQNDYTFQILSLPISKQTEEIEIFVDGATQTLIKEQQQWVPKEQSESFTTRLAEAIGKAIGLRYRI